MEGLGPTRAKRSLGELLAPTMAGAPCREGTDGSRNGSGSIVAAKVGDAALKGDPSRVCRVPRKEAYLPKHGITCIAKNMGRVGWNDDNAPSVIAHWRLVCEGAFADSFKAHDDLFDAMLVRWDLCASLEHVFVRGALLGSETLIR